VNQLYWLVVNLQSTMKLSRISYSTQSDEIEQMASR